MKKNKPKTGNFVNTSNNTTGVRVIWETYSHESGLITNRTE